MDQFICDRQKSYEEGEIVLNRRKIIVLFEMGAEPFSCVMHAGICRFIL